jgi:protein-disulfide isomerase
MRVFFMITILSLVNSFAFALDSNEAYKVPELVMTKDEILAVQTNDIVVGDKNAPVTIVEYASMSCTHCADFHNEVFGDLKERFIDTGKVRWVFRDFPLDEPALRASMMGRCAGSKSLDNFVKFNKVIFSTQSTWAPKKNYLEVLANIGKLGGMQGKEFDSCMANEELKNKIMEGKFYAAKYLEIRSTPSFFINGSLHKGGKDIEYLSKVIESLASQKTTSENVTEDVTEKTKKNN